MEELDEGLEQEVKMECENYGSVSNCIVHVNLNKDRFNSIRVFVEFERYFCFLNV
jgi:hypothetical protein